MLESVSTELHLDYGLDLAVLPHLGAFPFCLWDFMPRQAKVSAAYWLFMSF